MAVTFPAARTSTTTLRSGPAALLVEQEGGREQQQPKAKPEPHGGAPGAAATRGWRRGTVAGRSSAAAGGSLSEGPGASAAHSPGEAAGSTDLSAARRAPQFVGPAPSPRRRACSQRGGFFKGRERAAEAQWLPCAWALGLGIPHPFAASAGPWVPALAACAPRGPRLGSPGQRRCCCASGGRFCGSEGGPEARRDEPDPRVAGLGAWTETSAWRLALPCGGGCC